MLVQTSHLMCSTRLHIETFTPEYIIWCRQWPSVRHSYFCDRTDFESAWRWFECRPLAKWCKQKCGKSLQVQVKSCALKFISLQKNHGHRSLNKLHNNSLKWWLFLILYKQLVDIEGRVTDHEHIAIGIAIYKDVKLSHSLSLIIYTQLF